MFDNLLLINSTRLLFLRNNEYASVVTTNPSGTGKSFWINLPRLIAFPPNSIISRCLVFACPCPAFFGLESPGHGPARAEGEESWRFDYSFYYK